MGLFSKKISLDDILKAINELPEDEREAIKSRLEGEKSNDEQKTDEAAAAPEVEAADKADDAPATEAIEPPAEEQTPTEPPAPAPTEAEETPIAAEDDLKNTVEALSARIESLTESYGKLQESVNSILDSLDSKPFGNHGPGAPSGEQAEDEESAVMRAYNRKQTNFR